MDLCPPIWERQKGERSKAYYMFTLYRDLGPMRSIAKLHKTIINDSSNTITTRQLGEYSRKCEWIKRAAAYDDYLDEILRKENEESLKEMVKRHSEDSLKLQDTVKDILDDPEFGKLSPTQKAWALNTNIHSYVKIALLERLSRGETTDKTETNAHIKAEKIDVFDDIKELKETIKLSEKDENKL